MNANTQSTINQGVKNSHPFTGIFREPIWQKAYVKNISLGYAAVIPLNFSEYFYLKLGKKDLELEQLSYLMMYRTSQGKMVAEFVIVTPSAKYFEEGCFSGKPFTGTIQVFDWQLNHLRGFRFSEDGTIKNLENPQFAFLTEKEREIQSEEKYEQKDCVITDWYSCPGHTTTVTSACTYMFTEIDCSTSDSGSGNGDGGTSGGGSEPGTPNPGDYPTGGGGNGTTPNNPPSSEIPCPGDPLVNMSICPSKNSGVLGGTYGWTRKYDEKTPKFHDGFDLAAPINTPVYSPWDNGVVVSPMENTLPSNYYNKTSYGNYVWVEYSVNGQKVRMRFAHLNTVNVRIGDKVSHSTILGLSGKTGNANSDDVIPHVHIQVMYYDSATRKWVQSKNGATCSLYPKCNPDYYLPSNFDYTTGRQTKSPCDNQKPQP